MYVYVNGDIVPAEEAKISVFDHGLMYGLGLFETFRWCEKGVFCLEAHVARLKQSLQQVHIAAPVIAEEMEAVLLELGRKNGLSEAYVRWNVTAGVASLGLAIDRYEQPGVIVYMKPLPPTVTAKLAQLLTLPRNTPEGSLRLKSHHYMNNVLAKRELGANASVEGFFLTADGYVAEGITSNIFWLRDGQIYTPSLETGILNGVTRAYMIECLRQKQYTVTEGRFSVEALLAADGWWITNAIQGVVAITQLDAIQNRALDEIEQIQRLYEQARADELR